MRFRLLMAFGLISMTLLSACDSGSPAATATPPAAAATPTAATGGSAGTPTTAPQATPGTGGQVNYPGGSATLNGAGATFPLPLISQWAVEYNKLYPGVKINYQGIGSGGGKNQFINKTVDFAATDSPLSDSEYGKVGGPDKALHIPLTIGAVVLAYNLKGFSQQIKLTGPVIADIYLLKITKWSDPAITTLNPGVSLPDTPIAVVHRAEGSGTTDIFTDYLSKVSPQWKAGPGRGTVVSWPGGIGAQGNDGVTNLIKLTNGSIGYVEASYAKKNNLQYALINNKAGNYVDATSAAVSEAADSVVKASLPADLRFSLTDTGGPGAYPIAGTDWALAYTNQTDSTKGKVLAYFLWWATHEGQKDAEPLFYAPLPASLVAACETQIKKMMCGQAACFP
jgi:phosphate transport system substrate-binding protein